MLLKTPTLIKPAAAAAASVSGARLAVWVRCFSNVSGSPNLFKIREDRTLSIQRIPTRDKSSMGKNLY